MMVNELSVEIMNNEMMVGLRIFLGPRIFVGPRMFVWQERNTSFFENKERSEGEVLDLVIVL